MSELEKAEGDGLQPYEPGIPPAEVNRAAFARFLPASVATMGLLFFGFFGMPLSEAIFIPLILSPLVAGFWGGLRFLRGRLFPDAELGGRRSVLAGLLAPLLTLIVEALAPSMGIGAAMGLSLVMGVVMAIAMFFAWLTPTPAELRPPGWQTADDGDETSPPRLDQRCLIALRRSLPGRLPSVSVASSRRSPGLVEV